MTFLQSIKAIFEPPHVPTIATPTPESAPDPTSTPIALPPNLHPLPAALISAGILSVISVILLIAACGVVAFTYKDTNLNSAQVDKLAEGLGKVIIGGAVFAWAGYRNSRLKRYTLLVFSAFCFVVILWFAYNARVARKQSKGLDQEQSRRLVQNLNDLTQQAVNSAVPQMKPTGVAGVDAALPSMNAFFQDYFGYRNRMEDEIDALHREDVFSLSMLSKQSSIESEIRKAVESQKIIERYRNGFPALVESALVKYSSSRKMSPGWQRALLDFEKILSVRVPETNEMFSLRLRRDNADAAYLRFMLAAFGDYQFAGQTITFKTTPNSKPYKELTQAIQDAIKDAETIQKRRLEEVEAAKAQIQKLAE